MNDLPGPLPSPLSIWSNIVTLLIFFHATQILVTWKKNTRLKFQSHVKLIYMCNQKISIPCHFLCATDISISCLKKIQYEEFNEYKLKINPTKKVSYVP